MSTYVIVGASKGLGREFVKQLSENASNTVFAVVRKAQGPITELAQKQSNVHLVEADATDAESLPRAAAEVSKITGGRLDVLIYNSNALDAKARALAPSKLPVNLENMTKAFEPSLLTGIYGAIWSANSFLPLIEAGVEKKIVFISSAMAEVSVILKSETFFGVPYSVMKAGMNVLAAKYAAELAPKDIKTLSIAPGWIDTWEGPDPKPDNLIAILDAELKMFQRLDPKMKGQITPSESVHDMMEVINRLDSTLSGQFVSQHGNKTDWF